ncbi:MAG TPA: serine kinase [Rhodobacteraceae bacterium]|nr:serine kinase [Paracoccaceae bacterium]
MNSHHGTAISRNGRAALLLGASGAGKSRLALELLALGADLVADDAVSFTLSGKVVFLSCAPSIKGMIEARGVGLLTVKAVDKAALAIVVNLDKTAEARLPALEEHSILGVSFPLIRGKGNAGLAAVVWCLLGGGQILPVE